MNVSTLQQLSQLDSIHVIFSLDVDEVIQTIRECFSFNYSRNCDFKSDCDIYKNKSVAAPNDEQMHAHVDSCCQTVFQRRICYLLAGIVIGRTVQEKDQQRVNAACTEGLSLYPIVPCCCTPSEVMQYLSSGSQTSTHTMSIA